MSKENKKSKKIIIIAMIILLVIIAGGVGGYFAYQNIEENKSTGTDWGDTYYNILNSTAEANQGKSDYSSLIETDAEDTTVQFIEVEEDEIPYMVVSYTKDDENKVMVCKLNDPDNESTSVSTRFNDANLEYLYNISLEQNIWYVHSEDSTTDTYRPLYTEIEKVEEYYIENGYIEEIAEDEEAQDVGETYVISKDSATSVETVDGETLSISEYDQTFVEIEVDESSKISLDFDSMSSKEMKTAVTDTVSEYKTNDEIMTEKIKTIVAEKVEEVNTKLAEIQEAEEAVAAKKAEEEEAAAKKAAEEEAAKGLKVGNYTLKYGKYTGSLGQYADNSRGSVTVDITLELKTDGTYTIAYTNSTDTSIYPNTTSSGTYSIETNLYGMSGYFLMLSSDSWYQVTANNTLEVTVR